MTDQADPSTAARIREATLRVLAEAEASDDDFALPPLDENVRAMARVIREQAALADDV